MKCRSVVGEVFGFWLSYDLRPFLSLFIQLFLCASDDVAICNVKLGSGNNTRMQYRTHIVFMTHRCSTQIRDALMYFYHIRIT
jgi:hypothetical protein